MAKTFKIVFILFSVFFARELKAQLNVLDQRYSFRFTNIPIEDVVDTLRKTVNCGFTYNPDLFPQKCKVNAVFRNQKLKLILDSVFFPANLVYKVVDNNIVIFPKDNNQPETESVLREDTLSYLALSGRIIDRKNKDPLGYVSIYIRNRNIGTVSNEDGNFLLKLPVKSGEDSVFLSCIGYKSLALKAGNLTGYSVIPMEPVNFALKEVRVKPVKTEDILRKTRENIPKNYSAIAQRLLAFYRETIQQNNEYVALSEAVLQIYKAPYDDYTNDQVVIYKGRKSHFQKQMDTVIFKFQGGIYTSLMLDIAKNPSNFLSDEYMGYYDFSLDEIIPVQGRATYVIAFDQKPGITFPLFKGKIYIDVETSAIVRAEFMISPRGLNEAGGMLVRKSPRRLKVKPVASSYIVNYNLTGNTWYLNYIREEIEFKVRKKFALSGTSFRSKAEMVITQADTVNVQKFKNCRQVRSNDIFVETLGKYDPEFWGSFNVINPDETLLEALHKIKKKPESIAQP